MLTLVGKQKLDGPNLAKAEMPPWVQQPPFPDLSAVGILLECLFQALQRSCVSSFITVCLWQEDKGAGQSAAQTKHLPTARIGDTWTPFLA